MAYNKGDIPVRSSANVMDFIPVGTDGHVLMADSTQTKGVKWAAPSGTWTTIKTIDANNDATISFINGVNGVVLDSTYDEYIVFGHSVKGSSDNNHLRVRTTTNAGSSWDNGGSDYQYANFGANTSGSNFADDCSTGDSKIVIGSNAGNDTGESIDFSLRLAFPSGTTQYKRLSWDASYKTNSGVFKGVSGRGERSAVADIDGIEFSFGSGNVAVGAFILVGIKRTS